MEYYKVFSLLFLPNYLLINANTPLSEEKIELVNEIRDIVPK